VLSKKGKTAQKLNRPMSKGNTMVHLVILALQAIDAVTGIAYHSLKLWFMRKS
jgi:DUF1365 family protein